MSEQDSRRRYVKFSDAELLELAASGESSFRQDAWRSLEDELRKRELSLEASTQDVSTDAIANGSGTARPDQELKPEVPVPAGIGGWLAFFVGLMVLGAAGLAVVTVEQFRSLSWFAPFSALQEIAVIVGLVLIFRRDRSAPALWKGLFVLTAVLDVFLAAADQITWSSAAFYAAWSLTWAGYWANSQRVHATFNTRTRRESRLSIERDVPTVDHV